MNPHWEKLHRNLAQSDMDELAAAVRPRAAVALVLSPPLASPEVLLIERTTRKDDPWSGHIALPGGKMEFTDPTPRLTAERETLEEIGLTLQEDHYLGWLGDFGADSLPLVVSCYVYGLDQTPTTLQLNPDEVEAVYAFPLHALQDPGRQDRISFQKKTYPAIRLDLKAHPLLWGLTYRMLLRLHGML